MNFLTSWSGGKDSCYAMMKAIENNHIPQVLFNMMNENGKISRSHGLPLTILKQQADQMNLPLEAVPATWDDYERKYVDHLKKFKNKYQLDAAVFGDIDLQAHKDWEDKVCKLANITAILPLWQQDRIVLVNEMIAARIETMIVSCNEEMGENYLGRILTKELALELERRGIDPCGENGEFHTLVINCPLFQNAIILPSFTKIKHNHYYFLNWNT
ncbi:Dph6-related ATP pyrophosphatase [Flavobacterium algicola]|uniref:Dph6-related ATP pyrophosphatase n=1 Tax=Flavobacterium algicola TaxID=556529 RepID=UPI001EFEA0D9|nr:diphthine--ammonia ligase [Flavobacterium algicola]MCG9792542.1 diphthine--ammonia ligase [Flavobacterium algicola]